jgi:hypothetical protein
MRRKVVSGLVFGGLTASAVVAANGVVPATPAVQQLQTLYSGVQAISDQGRVIAIAGAPMTPGLNAAQAAEQWIAAHGEAFGAGAVDLRLQWSTPLQDGRGTVFAYQQYIQGYPVEHGNARILVKHEPINRVVYAGGTLAPMPGRAFGPTVDAEAALEFVKAQKEHRHLPEFGEPELVIYQGEGEWIAPVLCWKFSGEVPSMRTREYWTFFVDATMPRIVHVRNEILHAEINGHARGRASPWSPLTNPDIPSNPPQFFGLPGLAVNSPGLQSAYTDDNGNFTIQSGAAATAMLDASLAQGSWVRIIDETGPTLTASVQGTSSASALLSFNDSPTQFRTAQVNVFIHTNLIHNFIRSRSGNWNLIDWQIDANVNLNQTCNAFFEPSPSINFFRSGGGCVNTGYSTVVAHEYGHFVVNRLNLGQGGFGEGFSDTCSMLLYNDEVLGRNFENGQPVRLPYTANQQYPCSEPIHTCGQILAGAWWGIKLKMEERYGAAAGLERTQQMFVDWMLITTGGTGPSFKNSAHPGTALQILTLDDDDGYLPNGTPNYAGICTVFRSHNIGCPSAPVIGFDFPGGRPHIVPPGQAVNIQVDVVPMMGTPVAGSARLIYRVNGGNYSTVTMAQGQPNRYTATIPAQVCGTNVDYYFSAQGNPPPATPPPSPVTLTSPFNGPAGAYWVGFAHNTTTIFEDDFETDQGWSGFTQGDNATTGRWTRNIPQATAAQPGEDHTPGTGLRCWITDHRAGTQVSDFDVDDGKTTLTSPAFNLMGRVSPRIGFWLWYSNLVGIVNPGTNVFSVELSGDDGNSWHGARQMGLSNQETAGGWKYYEVAVEPFVPVSSGVRVRFIAADYTGSIVEAAVDDVQVYALFCDPVQCYPNCDGSLTPPVLNVNDFVCFLQKFAAGDPYANCDGSTMEPVLNIIDFTCFLQKFSAGCP